MKAQRSFTVRPRLPEGLRALEDLAANLRWSWDRHTQALFERIDPDLWERCRHDPRKLLASVEPSRLDELGDQQDFVEQLRSTAEELATYSNGPRWFGQFNGSMSEASWPDGRSVAYFSPEFGISEAIPQYSGGLGVLAGDHVKAASDLGVPLVAIGLFYRHGYFRQELSVDGWQHERFADLDPHALALEHCENVRVELELAGRPAVLQVWRAMVGRVPLFLLDADVADNEPEIQLVTDRLYGGDVEHRLRQEILLGIGGVRALRALGESPLVFHSNEGHAGFLGLELIRSLVTDDGLTLAEAFEAVRSGSVFTTHTPVPAGIDRFPRPLIEKYFSGWAEECGVTIDDLMRLGRSQGPQAEDRFNMAVMGMRLARQRNGVSDLHGQVSRSMFSELWPGVPHPEVPVAHITNGVHGDTWTSPEFSALYESALGRRWQWDPDSWASVDSLDDAEIWSARSNGRARLVA
ncbi:MAG: alpha-glucan family phosphorylase, partial [Microthrixaceae bacterium]